MGPRERLLYLSPVVPATTGNGLAMRAGTVLRALAERYDVTLLVVPLYISPAPTVPAEIADRCRRIVIEPLAVAGRDRSRTVWDRARRWVRRRWWSGQDACAAVGAGVSTLLEETFDVLHVFRLAALPFARPWLGGPGRALRRDLDLDDVESISRRRVAVLCRRNGQAELARAEEAAAERSAALEATVLQEFDRVYVCSAADRSVLRRRGGADLWVLPNALPVPSPLPPRAGDGPFDFLFVGTLGYYPNEDAIVHFCTAVLPLLRRAARREFRVTIVGTAPTPAVRQIAGLPDVRLIGAVPEVAPWYGRADAVIVPIRAGGGTRIKVLEAFSYRRAVVSTSIGVEGIGARDGEHVLIGDGPAAFAARCARLMADRQLAERLTAQAFQLFLRDYTVDALARRLAGGAAARPCPPLAVGG